LKNFRAHSVFRASASCSKILNVKSIFNTVKIFRAHAVFQGKRRLLKNPESQKYIQYSAKRQGLLFFRASGSCSKILNVESIFNTVKIFRTHAFFRASASCSKILNAKISEHSVFRASASCSKILNVKTIFNTVKNFRALYFQGKRKLLKNPECKKYIKYSENFQGTLCFQGKRRLLKNPECNSIY